MLGLPASPPSARPGVEVAQQVLAETQGVVMPPVPYLDTLRWLFIAVALGGIALAIYARLEIGSGAGGDRRLFRPDVAPRAPAIAFAALAADAISRPARLGAS